MEGHPTKARSRHADNVHIMISHGKICYWILGASLEALAVSSSMNTISTSHKGQFIYAIGLLEDLEPRAADPSLRVVPIPTLREFAGAFEDVEELAEEGLFPSTESSSSKILSAKKKKKKHTQL